MLWHVMLCYAGSLFSMTYLCAHLGHTAKSFIAYCYIMPPWCFQWFAAQHVYVCLKCQAALQNIPLLWKRKALWWEDLFICLFDSYFMPYSRIEWLEPLINCCLFSLQLGLTTVIRDNVIGVVL